MKSIIKSIVLFIMMIVAFAINQCVSVTISGGGIDAKKTINSKKGIGTKTYMPLKDTTKVKKSPPKKKHFPQ